MIYWWRFYGGYKLLGIFVVMNDIFIKDILKSINIGEITAT